MRELLLALVGIHTPNCDTKQGRGGRQRTIGKGLEEQQKQGARQNRSAYFASRPPPRSAREGIKTARRRGGLQRSITTSKPAYAELLAAHGLVRVQADRHNFPTPAIQATSRIAATTADVLNNYQEQHQTTVVWNTQRRKCCCRCGRRAPKLKSERPREGGSRRSKESVKNGEKGGRTGTKAERESTIRTTPWGRWTRASTSLEHLMWRENQTQQKGRRITQTPCRTCGIRCERDTGASARK